ncbi:MAG TPA: hypothetical protein VEW46_04765 [Pyrinomonadaceae bacterium]|nr:hypothetical protein [Pyrinomonadaceae bacterium]
MRYDALVSEQNSNLLNYIGATVETLRDQIATMRDQMATKADLAALREQMATKADLAAVKDDVAAIREQMATKKDLAHLESRLELRIDTKTTAIRGDVEQVQLRLDSIDRALSGRMGLVETEVSRLRSVVYLLVKDKPDMLRLLGQSGLHEHRPPS